MVYKLLSVSSLLVLMWLFIIITVLAVLFSNVCEETWQVIWGSWECKCVCGCISVSL